MKKTLLLMTAVALMAVGCTEKRDADELRAEKLMAKMTLTEKIGLASSCRKIRLSQDLTEAPLT